jgi:Zn-dependent M28 family amino/carboxypeptidase
MIAANAEVHMRTLVEALCSAKCAGRKPGTLGGMEGRLRVKEAFQKRIRSAEEQPVPAIDGANVIAEIPGTVDRWVVVAAHHDHLGEHDGEIFAGADDNAAAVAILVEVGAALVGSRGPAQRREGRGILLIAFDGEEAPYFATGRMGSQHWVAHPTVPLDRVDMMVCMDLMGHALGPAGLPASVRETVFALGAERSTGTAAVVDGIQVPGVSLQRLDAEVIPPLSDYLAFWRQQVPFLFLTCGRWQHYHTPQDTPEKLDYPKMAAAAEWLARYVYATSQRPGSVAFTDVRDDRSTLQSLTRLATALEAVSPAATAARQHAQQLLGLCDAQGRLPEARRGDPAQLVELLESSLA